jgi:outer membrane immunogenic protein
MSKRLFKVALLLVLTVSCPAMAADVFMTPPPPTPPKPTNPPSFTQPPPPTIVYDWTGFYAGVNGGVAWGHSRQDQIAPVTSSTGEFDVSGGLVGGTIGFNLQANQVVFGLEGDLDWAHIRGNAACAFSGFNCVTQTDYLGTVRARLGYVWGQLWLPYITGGAAIGDIKESVSPAFAGNTGTTSNRVGWTVGGGLQVAPWNNNWTINFEFLYSNLGTFICTTACSGVTGRTINTTLTQNIFRTGVNYRF